MKEKIYYITGMHCASCELLIEKRVLKEDGVKSVEASLGNGTLRIEYEGEIPHEKNLNTWFKEDGYTFSSTKKEQQKELLVYFVEGRGLKIDKKIFKRKAKTALLIVLIFFVLYNLEKSGVAQYVSVNSGSSLGLFIIFGVVAGLSSCAALVGGIILSLTKSWNEKYGYEADLKTKMTPHIYFHSGRLLSYAVFGAALGALGKAFTFENITAYALITMVVSLVMLVIGLQMAGFRFAKKLQFRMPKILTRKVALENSEQNKKFPFMVGAGTILLPCGFTLIAQGIALTSGSMWRGAMVLTMFVIGTMIPLLFIGLASAKSSASPKKARTFSFYSGVVLIMFAIYNINGQLNVLGFSSVSDVLSKEGSDATLVSVNKEGEQIVTMVAKGFEYTFTSSSKINSGVPTKLVVDNQGVLGCGAFLSARGLINNFVSLKPGENIIDIGSPKKGTYKITCSMGMVPPINLTVI